VSRPPLPLSLPSTPLCRFSLSCIIEEIRLHHTSMWTGVPPLVSILLFFLLLLCVGLLEGLQIALFAAANLNLSDCPHETARGSGPVDAEQHHLENIPSPLPLPSARRPPPLSPVNELSTETSSPSLPTSVPPPLALAAGPSVTAMKNCALVFRGKNFASFVVGRQICVTFLTVLVPAHRLPPSLSLCLSLSIPSPLSFLP
jgi:hypothetical protein